MREQERIKRILDKLNVLWSKHPDERFFQFMINRGMCPNEFHFWRLEDNIIEEHLDKLLSPEKSNERKPKRKSKKV